MIPIAGFTESALLKPVFLLSTTGNHFWTGMLLGCDMLIHVGFLEINVHQTAPRFPTVFAKPLDSMAPLFDDEDGEVPVEILLF
jgi:hypothetical protein